MRRVHRLLYRRTYHGTFCFFTHATRGITLGGRVQTRGRFIKRELRNGNAGRAKLTIVPIVPWHGAPTVGGPQNDNFFSTNDK